MSHLPPVPSNHLLSEAWASFRRCLHKDHYARLSGRAGRFEYWSATIIGTLISILPGILPLILPNLLSFIGLLIWFVVITYFAMPLLAVYVRRLHDVGWSAWWIAAHYALISVLYAVFVFHVTQAVFFTSDMVELFSHVLPRLLPWLEYTAIPLNVLSTLLFILTLLPGKTTPNRYGNPV
jgi:uncharacterized membrane protein YhaH (DUF805 family)